MGVVSDHCGTGSWARLRIAHADGRLSLIGDVRLVVSKHRSRIDTIFRASSLVSSVTRQTVVLPLMNIEVLFKKLRGDLGPGDCQVMSEEANHNIQTTLHSLGLTPTVSDR